MLMSTEEEEGAGCDGVEEEEGKKKKEFQVLERNCFFCF